MLSKKILGLMLVVFANKAIFSQEAQKNPITDAERQMVVNCIEKIGYDTALCRLCPSGHPENFSGKDELRFTVIEYLGHRLDLDSEQCRRVHQAIADGEFEDPLFHNEMSRLFHKCMSDLDNPEVAVQDGEYKKCVKETWAKYQQFNLISINRQPDLSKIFQIQSAGELDKI